MSHFFRETFLVQKLNNRYGHLLMGLVAIAIGSLLAVKPLLGIIVVASLLGLFTLGVCLFNPEVGLYILMGYGFFVYFFLRVFAVENFPFGILFDALLFTSLFGVIMRNPDLKKTSHDFFRTPAVIWVVILCLYTGAELFNPLAHSFDGWYAAFRKSFEEIFLLFVAYNLFDTNQKIKTFITVLFVLCATVGLYGCVQQWHGLFGFDLAWVTADPERFRLIFQGDFRKFSTFPDPVSFGIVMGCGAVFFALMAIYEQSARRRWMIFCGMIFMMLAMVYSGTRTANVVFVAGIVIFILMTFNRKQTRIFAFLAMLVFVGALYAPIYSIASLNRFRSSFAGTHDASYRVREMDRAFIQPYIYHHPFGGGLGTTGNVGKSLNPGHPLAGFQTDDGYLRIALEMGWIGLIIVCCLNFVILRTAIRAYFQCEGEALKRICMASLACMFALAVAELAQEVIGQFGDDIVFFPILAVILRTTGLNKQGKSPEPPPIS
jgi:putative inorganic carbon (HCO3(-)) transporter